MFTLAIGDYQSLMRTDVGSLREQLPQQRFAFADHQSGTSVCI
jgi:hypothetical protein